MKKKKIKKVLNVALATTILVMPMQVNIVNALSFEDVKNDHWAAKTIQDFVNKGYIGGYSDNTFKPENSITRAEFIKIVNQTFGYKEITSADFTDVKSNQWFYNDVCIAIKAGYIKGYEDKTFRPNKQITREEVAVIITNIKKNKDTNYDKINKYKDLKNISNWAKSSVEGALEAKYIGGYSDNTIKPKANITRAESVSILSRIPVNQPTTPENPLPSKIMYTTGDPIVNVRKGPGTNYEKLGTLPKGSKVEVVDENNGWAKIKYNNTYAYVSISYLTSGQSQKPLPQVPYTPINIDTP
ncbi:S-layer homology domain-containing protein [Romboutsia lituseburensis]|uniref:S-layer homology domain-containing protein n=1 Tax=Romboutsia lituseburensis TaxID=1537 RepID=UPI002812414C|nr:S-layer homology domain-containing protein [Romboutsia lituseburensis]